MRMRRIMMTENSKERMVSNTDVNAVEYENSVSVKYFSDSPVQKTMVYTAINTAYSSW